MSVTLIHPGRMCWVSSKFELSQHTSKVVNWSTFGEIRTRLYGVSIFDIIILHSAVTKLADAVVLTADFQDDTYT